MRTLRKLALGVIGALVATSPLRTTSGQSIEPSRSQ